MLHVLGIFIEPTATNPQPNVYTPLFGAIYCQTFIILSEFGTR